MPQIYLIGGPNGAGKTTSAMTLLPELLQCEEYVNADAIAAGLSPFAPGTVAITAGRLMVRRIEWLAQHRKDFAFETTMASRMFVSFLQERKRDGYSVNLLYLWLMSPELALRRVASRVMDGGHHVPEELIRRRYRTGLMNFFNRYIPIADSWTLYDNSGFEPRLVALGSVEEALTIRDEPTWASIQEMIR
ncbi:MAG: zeta toxin family protein [Acidobacteria bacterium]|nr:zeta toxin family protein [Acidobacteriota bacterium]